MRDRGYLAPPVLDLPIQHLPTPSPVAPSHAPQEEEPVVEREPLATDGKEARLPQAPRWSASRSASGSGL